jgi:hypothetical protein
MLFYLGLAAPVNAVTRRWVRRTFAPKLARAFDLAMVAVAGFVVVVVPVVFNAARFAVRPFFEKPAKGSGHQDAEVCSPSVWLPPVESKVKNHAASRPILASYLPTIVKDRQPFEILLQRTESGGSNMEPCTRSRHLI